MAWEAAGWDEGGDFDGMAVRLAETVPDGAGGFTTTVVGYWQTTSTTTILVTSADGDSALRLFTSAGNNWSAAFGDWDFDGSSDKEEAEDRLWRAIQDPPSFPRFPDIRLVPLLARLRDQPAYLSWLESTLDASTGDLVLDVVQTDPPGTVTTSTWIPTMKLNQRLPVSYVAEEDGSLHVCRLQFAVQYADPCCVKMPDNSDNPGYLMLFARYRTPHCAGGREADEAVSDIVAYWSPDADFASTDLRGPFLLVRSTGALPDTDLRMWMGVPGGVFAEDDGEWPLFLYYICVQSRTETETSLSTGETGWCVLMDDAEWYNAAIEAYDATTAAGSPPYPLANDFDHIAARRISLDALDAAISEARETPTTALIDESRWDDEDAVEVAGERLGHVRVWVPDDLETASSKPLRVVDFLRYWAEDNAGESLNDSAVLDLLTPRSNEPDAVFHKYPKLVDPGPTWCDDVGRLNLYFCCRKGPNQEDTDYNEDNGHGIWRAAALPGGKRLRWAHAIDDGASGTAAVSWTAVFGRDFIVARPSGDEPSRDMVADTGGSDADDGEVSQIYADPDPVQLPSGEWAVFIGANCLWRVESTEGDGCRAWDAVFTDATGETVRVVTLSDVWRRSPGPPPIRLADAVPGGLKALRPYGMRAWLARAEAARPPATSPG